ncbi:sugar transferase [Hydrotalea sp.]|uniref:sugar transferase n=1 Tax=Hydrotalea sp. TaxID=2881279 RepID=UPI0026058C18|nr:sugar transferase [Hydrotalea sp.]
MFYKTLEIKLAKKAEYTHQHQNKRVLYYAAKRSTDIILSFLALILLLPLIIFISIKTKISSPGSIFYCQERMGFRGIPFTIYKFRSMYADAEKNGPQLSSNDDQRITTWGKIMRKWRLDEIPQLWNIIKGDMSLVGPRPERQFYTSQLIEIVPNYAALFLVKPGLTSSGMIEFGYASNITEMVERAQYDLAYVQKRSFFLDIAIILKTFFIIILGKGK